MRPKDLLGQRGDVVAARRRADFIAVVDDGVDEPRPEHMRGVG